MDGMAHCACAILRSTIKLAACNHGVGSCGTRQGGAIRWDYSQDV